MSHLSAAQLAGWELAQRPPRPAVTVPRNRKVEPWRRDGVEVRWRDLTEDEVWHGRTTAGRTVVDCAKDLPFDEALTVADSALRHGNVTTGQLLRLAEQVPSTAGGSACASPSTPARSPRTRSSPCCGPISLDVADLVLEPQVVIEEAGFVGRPDLVDRERRIAVEADSFEFHGKPAALRRDCERYNALALQGWLVLRFSWEHVVHDPAYVRVSLESATVDPATHLPPAAGGQPRRARAAVRPRSPACSTTLRIRTVCGVTSTHSSSRQNSRHCSSDS